MTQTAVTERTTPYVTAVRHHMMRLGHATNAELIEALRGEFPNVSATTVHRVTARLLERGEVRQAPASLDNTMRFDANTELHDHFMCDTCGMLKDADLNAQVRPLVEEAVGDGCSISGSLTISGTCHACQMKKERER